jgi:hypothetical protein
MPHCVSIGFFRENRFSALGSIARRRALPEGTLFRIMPSLVLSTTFSENRFPLFRVML